MKAEVGDYVVYRTELTPDDYSDYFGLVRIVSETGVELSVGPSVDWAKWDEIKDVVKGSKESKRLALEYNANYASK